MDGNEFDGNPQVPTPPAAPHQTPPQDSPAPYQPAAPQPAWQTTHPQNTYQPGAVPAGNKQGMNGCLKAALIVSGIGFVLTVVLVVGLVLFAFFASSRLEAEGGVEQVAVEPLEPEPAPATLPEPVTLDGVTVTWADSPSDCDTNGKRLLSADFDNGTSETLALRIRILDSSNNFVHQSHVYTALAGQTTPVDLGGIPEGKSIVQMIDESTDEAIDQITVNFEGC